MVQVKKMILEDNLYYQKKLLVSYRIEYPHFVSNKYKSNLNMINKYYKDNALARQKYCVDMVFKAAIEQFEFSEKRNLPIRKFELNYLFNLTHNEICLLSLYYDLYEYLGGAHGLTIRTADTWDVENGKMIKLCELFKSKINYYNYIYESIINQMESQTNLNDKKTIVYYDIYKENVYVTLDLNNFYLMENDIIIFFQQYDIAPYAAGIPEFLIPYNEKVMVFPNCGE